MQFVIAKCESSMRNARLNYNCEFQMLIQIWVSCLKQESLNLIRQKKPTNCDSPEVKVMKQQSKNVFFAIGSRFPVKHY